MSEQSQNIEVVKKRMLVILGSSVVLAVGTLFAFTPNASAAEHTFTAYLNGMKEVPGPGDLAGIGEARVTIDDATNQVCVATQSTIGQFHTLKYHIHRGAAGDAGPVVVDFKGQQNTCVAGDPSIVAAIIADPADFYVNLHTQAYPEGASRGQL